MGTNRDQFREAVLSRDRHMCVVCGRPALDAHHILERRLFPDGGYHLDNGASLCGRHHLAAEMTTLTVEELRSACGITKPVLPPHLYGDERYDKWGNILLPGGGRMRGELFDDPSVQKILTEGCVLGEFGSRVKYPRTWHLPISPGATKDDRVLPDSDQFVGHEVVATIKMDGENTTLYRDYLHARSVGGGRRHPSRDWVKNFHSGMAADIPDDWRVCGENLYAQHTIHYDRLESYFLGFSVWDGMTCLSWDDALVWFELLGIQPVHCFYRGQWDESAVLSAFPGTHRGSPTEGFVVRRSGAFRYGAFRQSVAKYVRAEFRRDLEAKDDSFVPWHLRPVVRNGVDAP